MASIIYSFTKEQIQEFFDTSCTYTEVLKKCNLENIGGNAKTLKKVIITYNINLLKFKSNPRPKIVFNRIAKNMKDILTNKISYITSGRLLKRLINEGYKSHICEKCKTTIWNNIPVALELNHIDGDRTNNSLENLEALCPNCHAQTSNWRGRKKRKHFIVKLFCKECNDLISRKNTSGLCRKCAASTKHREHVRKFNPSKNELEQLVHTLSMTKVGKYYGVSDNAIRKRCLLLNIKWKIIKNFEEGTGFEPVV